MEVKTNDMDATDSDPSMTVLGAVAYPFTISI